MKDIALALNAQSTLHCRPSPDCNGNPFLFRRSGRKDCSEKREAEVEQSDNVDAPKNKKAATYNVTATLRKPIRFQKPYRFIGKFTFSYTSLLLPKPLF